MGNKNELLQKIDEGYSKFSKGQKKLADFIKEDYDKAAFLTAAKMGEEVGVSESTVVRFAMALGYDGYPGFQKALGEMVRTKLKSIQRMEVTYGRISQGEILTSVLQSDIDKIKLTMQSIDHESFELAVETILNAKKIYVIGIRSCAPLASFLGRCRKTPNPNRPRPAACTVSCIYSCPRRSRNRPNTSSWSWSLFSAICLSALASSICRRFHASRR